MFSSKLPRGLKVTVFASLAAAVVLGVLQTVAMLTCYEFEVMLYYRDAVLPNIINVLLVLSVVLISAAVFVTSYKKELPVRMSKIGIGGSFFAAISAFLIFGSFAVEFIMFFVFKITPVIGMQAQRIFVIARIIFALPAGMFMLVTALGKRLTRTMSAVFSFCLVMWLAMCLITAYFDMTSPLNSPPRVLSILAYTSLMITSLLAMRFGINLPKSATWIAASMITAVLGAASAFPPLVLTTLGRYPLDSSTMAYAAQLALTIYCTVRACEFGGIEEEAPIDTAADEAEAMETVNENNETEENANEK